MKKNLHYGRYVFWAMASLGLSSNVVKAENGQPLNLPVVEFSATAGRFSEVALVKDAAQTITVSGRVVDNTGEGLPGVSVVVKGTTIGANTDIDGRYSLTVPNGNATLVFSYIGFVSQEVALNNRAVLDVTMATDTKTLEEVVVVGYGTQKKSDLTGAITSVSSAVIEERPVQNVLQALQGRAAGVNVSTNVRPGETPSVSIRGNRSLTADNGPLYVVDGIPIVAALGVTSFSINDIHPNDIASVEVLKDASATAIYGSRGANGVILITTKKGTAGKVSVNYNHTTSLDSYKSLTDWMDGGQYIDRWRESLMYGRNYQLTTNTDRTQAPTIWYPDPFIDREKMNLGVDQRSLNNVWAGYEWEEYGVTPRTRPTTPEEQAMGWPAQVPVYNSQNIPTFDWRDAATRTGVTQNHQLSLSSGTETSRVYLSLGYYDQKGVQRDQDFKRFNVNLNGDISPKKWLTLGTSVMGSFSLQNYGVNPPNTSNTGSKDLFSRANDQFPFAFPRDENGDFIRNTGPNINIWNPLVDIDQTKNERRSSAIMANMFTELKFTPWLKYRLNFGAQVRNFRNGAWTGPEATSHLTNRPNTAGYNREENFSWVAENLLFVDKTFADIHTIGVTLLQSQQASRRENIGTNVSSTIIPLSLWYDLGSNTVGRPDGYGTGFTENTLMSWMGRINYSLMDRYLLTASGRYDGSSVLAPGNKWDFFPSFAFAWKMQEESFMENLTWISELKPRIGYGVTGNSSVNPYTSSGPLSRNPYSFGSVAGIGYLPQLVQNPNLSWEKTAQSNIGVDFGVLNNRITGSVELYEARTSDLIMERSLPAVTGYVNKFENIGKTRNRGLELTLSTVNIETKDFTWSTDINFSRNREEIVELINGKEDMLANTWFIGYPVSGVYRHYDNAGIWQNTPEDLAEMAKFNANRHNFYPGSIKIVDQNGDYRIDGEDYVIRGHNRPKWTGGLNTNFRYKNLTLQSFIYARVGQTYFGGYPNSYGGVFPNGRVENDVWTFQNPGGRWPMPYNGTLAYDNFTPAMQFHSGSFVTVRNISLSYDFPQTMLSRFFLNNLQLNVQVLNPFIFGGDIVQMGLNPDDDTNWGRQSQANSNSTSPLGGTNNNTILQQSVVFGLRVGF
ncbi:SusC/RagA family TonB-linked outer membrane protein [Pontibacter beigongshangensis]|uniref:SusC/RagA family TonB-linked outer membrane protein n=1 Tax=Pontibacter beigongshangensis TaxID=2574733 RepID=UPI00165062DE|nr:TonB-dependent receptor [Pontibacter beigongshangensis]